MTHPNLPRGSQRRSALRLLLSRGDSERPEVVLPQGLSPQLLDGAPQPQVTAVPAGMLAFGDQTRDASLLAERRWGLVVPAAEPLRGQLLAAIEPLIRVRAAQQRMDSATLLRDLVYIAPSDPYLPPPRAVDWYRHAIAEVDVADDLRRSEIERPDYLLVLGDLHQVSESITQVLCSYGHFVGRLAFCDEGGQPRLADYRRYAEKVAAAPDGDGASPDSDDDDGQDDSSAANAARPGRRARLLYVCDGSDATELANELLVSPLLARLARPHKKGAVHDLNSGKQAAIYGSDELLATAAGLSASLLFTVSHGYGGPRGGYSSPSEQRKLQGALSFASPSAGRGRRLSGDDLRALRTPFVPGGLWFLFACYGAGTPAESQFYHWLASRRDQLDDEARWVLRSLPASAQLVPDSHPFVAALPQAALAQEDGPLAIIGHLDLAWSYSFVESAEEGDEELGRGDYDHFETLVRSLMRQARVGAALTTLLRKRRSAEQSLLRRYDALRRAGMRPSSAPADGDRSTTADLALRRHWMTRQDLTGYVLLGDPAVRLFQRQPVVAAGDAGRALPRVRDGGSETAAAGPGLPLVSPVESQPTGAQVAPDWLRTVEDAIAQLTLDGRSAPALAAPLGLSESDLWALHAAYHRAGREALPPPDLGAAAAGRASAGPRHEAK
jgi:hypothetical protein